MALALLPFLSSNEENACDCDCYHHMAESKVIATDSEPEVFTRYSLLVCAPIYVEGGLHCSSISRVGVIVEIVD